MGFACRMLNLDFSWCWFSAQHPESFCSLDVPTEQACERETCGGPHRSGKRGVQSLRGEHYSLHRSSAANFAVVCHLNCAPLGEVQQGIKTLQQLYLVKKKKKDLKRRRKGKKKKLVISSLVV